MRRQIWIISAFSAGVLLTMVVSLNIHLDMRPLATMYNNTPYMTTLKIDSSATDAIRLPPGHKIEMRSLDFFDLCITAESVLWCYQPIPIVAIGPPPNLVSERGFFKRTPIFRVQLEDDGRIFVVAEGQSFPATTYPPQPDGFPLVPEPPRQRASQPTG